MAPSLYIIVLNWNRAADTLACVQSLQAVSHRPLEIIIVDNGSTDDSVTRLRDAFPGLTLIANDRNLGFAEGNNVGIRHAMQQGADYVMLLNNDTLAAPDAPSALLEAAIAHPEAGFLGTKIFYHDDPQRIWMGKPMWDPATCRFEHIGLNQLDGEAGLNTTSVASYACGCAVLVPRTTIDRIGLLDPRFFCYFEEIDWCFRGARQGLTSLYVPAAKIWHKVSASSGGKLSPVVRYFRARNSLLWAERNLAPRQRWRIFRQSTANTLDGFGWQETGAGARLRRAYWNLLTLQRDPLIRAWRHGVLDYLYRRFGDAPDAVKRLARADIARPSETPR